MSKACKRSPDPSTDSNQEMTMNISKNQKPGYGLIASLGMAFALGLAAPTNAADLTGPDITVR